MMLPTLHRALHRSLALTTLLAATVAGAASTAEAPGDYALNLALALPAEASLVRLELPLAAYEAMREPGLGDLRIFNGSGEALPIAILPPRVQEEVLRGSAPLLPLPRQAEGRDEGLQLSLLRGSDGRLTRLDLATTPGQDGKTPPPDTWLADLTDFPHPLGALELDWGSASGFEGQLRVEGSNDLQHWRLLSGGATLMSVEAGGQRIEKRRLELSGSPDKLRYLRLHWSGPQAAPPFAPLQLESRRKLPPGPSRWYPVQASAHSERGGYRYVAEALLPVTGVDIRFAQSNTVSQVRIASRPRAEARWLPAAAGSAFRLGNTPAGEQRSAPFRFAERSHALWQLEFDTATAPRQPPELLLGWTPHEIVFPARGPGPFVLAAGKPGQFPLQYTVAQLVPGYGTDAAPPLHPAQVDTTPLPTPAGKAAPLPPRRDAPAWANPRSWLLWGILIVGVLLLALMVRSLFREQAAQEKDGRSEGG